MVGSDMYLPFPAASKLVPFCSDVPVEQSLDVTQSVDHSTPIVYSIYKYHIAGNFGKH